MQKQTAGTSVADDYAAIVTVVDAVARSYHGAEERLPLGKTVTWGAVDSYIVRLGTYAAEARGRQR